MSIDEQFSRFRVVDAAANRASEGIRVVEDVARMHLNDPLLTKSLKQLRHELATIVERILSKNSLYARDTISDVGCEIETGSEYKRGEPGSERNGVAGSSLFAIVVANAKRTQQALRTIEEFAKSMTGDQTTPQTNAQDAAHAIEQIRYRSYTLEKALVMRLQPIAEFAIPSVYVLIDGIDIGERCAIDCCSNNPPLDSLTDTTFAKTVGSLVKANVDFIQLRDKGLSDRQLIAAGHIIRSLVNGSPTRFIINDRADIAVATRADGIHVGQEELSVSEVRRIVGSEMLVGVSTHSVEQAKQAVLDGASYIGVGPVFESNTKSFNEHVGCKLIQQVTSAVSIPAFAIGGIDLSNAKEVAEAGCPRVAVSGMFRELIGQADDMFLKAADELRSRLSLR